MKCRETKEKKLFFIRAKIYIKSTRLIYSQLFISQLCIASFLHSRKFFHKSLWITQTPVKIMWKNEFIGNDVPESSDHLEGESVLKSGNYKPRETEVFIRLGFQLDPNLDDAEADPVVYVDTNLHYGKMKSEMIRIPIKPSPKDVSKLTGNTISKKNYVSISYPKNRALPADASIWFHMQAKEKSSEGNYCYENVGSTQIYLGSLLSVSKEDDFDPPITTGYVKDNGKVVHTSLIRMSVLKFSRPKAEAKGTLHVWVHSAKNAENIKIEDRSDYDWVPYNELVLKKAMYMSIEQNMSLFNTFTDGKYGKPFRAISKELEHVHAPLYITPITPLPGHMYFSNLTHETNPNEKVYSRIARTVLLRTKISEDDFVKMCNLPEPTATEKEYPLELHQAAAMVVMMAALLPNSLPYIGDFAYVNNDGAQPPVTLSSHKQRRRDKRKEREKQKRVFSYGVGKFFGVFSKHSAERESDESFDDALLRKSGDCEDLAALLLRCLNQIQTAKWNDKVLIAAQGVAQHYAFAASLGSVTARNIKEGRAHHTGDVEINSQEDKNSGFGAHMWVTAVPLARIGEMVDKNNGSAYSKGEVTLPHGYTKDSVPGGWDKRLPVLIGEGTGQLYPLLLPAESYVEDIKDKIYIADQGVKVQDAYARFETGKSIHEIRDSGGSAQKYSSFSSIEIMKRQKEQRNNPNMRPSPFYRIYSSMFFLDSRDNLPSWNGWSSKNVSTPVDSKGPEDNLIRLGWELTRPAQVGTRKEDKGKEDDVGEEAIRHGTHLADMLNKRSHVGIVLKGQEAPTALKTIASACRHIPAPVKMYDFTLEEKKQLSDYVSLANKLFNEKVNEPKTSMRIDWEKKSLKHYPDLKKLGAIGILDSPYLSREICGNIKDSDLQMVQASKKILSEGTKDAIVSFAEEMSKNKYVLAARAYGEELANGVGNIRFDLIIDTTDRAKDNGEGFVSRKAV